MSKFQNYNGPDKYHFRFYRKNGKHPFLVVLVEKNKASNRYYFSGYMLTHDINKKIEYPWKYIKLHSNPNPKDNEPTFLCKTRLERIKQKMLSKPYKNWHLSKEDEMIVDNLEKKKISQKED